MSAGSASRRLPWLIGLAALLAVARVAYGPTDAAEPAVAVAISRPAPRLAASPTIPAPAEASTVADATEADPVGNAFAVRAPKPPAAAPPAAIIARAPIAPVAASPIPIAIAVPQAQAPQEPAVQSPPFRVIGTFDDGEPGVFVATTSGAVLARRGASLPGDYRLTELSRSEAVFTHSPTQRAARFPLPNRSGP